MKITAGGEEVVRYLAICIGGVVISYHKQTLWPISWLTSRPSNHPYANKLHYAPSGTPFYAMKVIHPSPNSALRSL
jgi:hypothetical protein